MENRIRPKAAPPASKRRDGGSGVVTKVTSSITNEPPTGSPVIVTDEIPLSLREMNSLGGFPEETKFWSNSELLDWRSRLLESKASTMSCSAYVKYAEKDATGELKFKVIGPFASDAAFTPECGGNSSSFRLSPAVSTTAFVKVTPWGAYVELISVPSANPSKVIVVESAETLA